MLKEPRSLRLGQTAFHEITALREGYHLPALKIQGIKISHYSFDRAVFSAMERKAHNHHRMEWERKEKQALQRGESVDPAAELQDWVFPHRAHCMMCTRLCNGASNHSP